MQSALASMAYDLLVFSMRTPHPESEQLTQCRITASIFVYVNLSACPSVCLSVSCLPHPRYSPLFLFVLVSRAVAEPTPNDITLAADSPVNPQACNALFAFIGHRPSLARERERGDIHLCGIVMLIHY